MLDLPLFAAIFVGRTAKTVSFVKRRENPRPDEEDDGPITRKHDWLVLDGLTESQARTAAAEDAESRKILDAARKAAQEAHLVRRWAILEIAKGKP
jgi:hypothetical protein